MRILVTGATGFIGARLLSRLAVECDELRVLRRRSSSSKPIKNMNFEDVHGDITDPDDVMKAVSGCDYVFHVAAIVSYWDKENIAQYNANVNGTRNVVEACIANKVRRLIHTSSVVAIGQPEECKLGDEALAYNMEGCNIQYSLTKHLAEEEVQKGVEKGLDAVIVNPGAVFGPGNVRRFAKNLYDGNSLGRLFYAGGGISTVDVDDVVEGHIRAWKKGKKGERYILSNENLTYKDVFSTIADVTGFLRPKIKIPRPFVFGIAYFATFLGNLFGFKPFLTVSMAKFTEMKLFYSNNKAKQELGMTFRPFRETIERTIDWYKPRDITY